MRILRACGQIAELIFSCTRPVLLSRRLGAGSPPPPPPRQHGREQAVVSTGADAASRFQRRSSAAPALFLIVGTGTAADRSLEDYLKVLSLIAAPHHAQSSSK